MSYTEAEAVVRNGLWHAKQVGHVETSPALVALDEMRREYENAEKRCETLTEHLAAANDLWEDDQSRLDETRELLNDKAARLAEAERLLRDVLASWEDDSPDADSWFERLTDTEIPAYLASRD